MIDKISINKCDYGNMVGYARVYLSCGICLTGIRIMKSPYKGLWLSMPAKKEKNNPFFVLPL